MFLLQLGLDRIEIGLLFNYLALSKPIVVKSNSYAVIWSKYGQLMKGVCGFLFAFFLYLLLVMLGRFVLTILFISCLTEDGEPFFCGAVLRVPFMCLHCLLWLSLRFF